MNILNLVFILNDDVSTAILRETGKIFFKYILLYHCCLQPSLNIIKYLQYYTLLYLYLEYNDSFKQEWYSKIYLQKYFSSY